MDLSSRKKLAAGLVILYAVSLAIFLPTLFQASPTTQILAIINPFTGGNYLWGRESGIIYSNGPINAVNLTYIVPINLTLPLYVITNYVNDNQNGTATFNTLVSKYKIAFGPWPGQTFNVTTRFFATTTEATVTSYQPPYKTNTTKNIYYEMFNTTPPTPFYYNYKTFTKVTMQVPNGQQAVDSAEFSNIFFNATLTFNSSVKLTELVRPVYAPNVVFNFTVVLEANVTYSPITEYITTAKFYFQEFVNGNPQLPWYKTFANSLQAVDTQVPGVATSTAPYTIRFVVEGNNYIFLVRLGLWSNITTVYVTGVPSVSTPYPPITYNGSFNAVVIPPKIIISAANIAENTVGCYQDNITIYAPDDMLNWTTFVNTTNAYADINEPAVNGPWDLSGTGLNVTLVVGGHSYSLNNVYIPLTSINFPGSPVKYGYKVYLNFLLSDNDNVSFVTPNNYPNITIVYVYVKPSDLPSAKIIVSYNDSDYAVQWLFSKPKLNNPSSVVTIQPYVPQVLMPPVESLSTSYFYGNLIDFDYRYYFELPLSPSDPTVLTHVSGNSELVMTVVPSANNQYAMVSIYYPNTPLYYAANHEALVGNLSAFIMFANGTTERIYLSNSNITTLFTGYTMPQTSYGCHNYTFAISIVGLESILGISPTQALTVLNNSYIILKYYDMVTGQTVTNMTKLVALPLNLTLQTGYNHALYWAPATPFADIVVPGTQIFYVVAVNNTLPIKVILTSQNLAASGVTSVTTSAITITYINQTTGSVKSVSLQPSLTLTLTGTNTYTGTFYLLITDENGNVVPISTPLNTSYLAYKIGNTVKVIGPISQIVDLKHLTQSRINITVTVLGTSASTFYQFIEIPNVIMNITPLVYNPVDGELSTTVASMVPNYYYSGYVILAIYTNSSLTKAIYTYQIYFNLSSGSPHFVVAYNLLPLSAILKGHTYYIILEAIVVPLTYEPDTTIGSIGIIYQGYFTFGS